jgi:hypothetical protein
MPGRPRSRSWPRWWRCAPEQRTRAASEQPTRRDRGGGLARIPPIRRSQDRPGRRAPDSGEFAPFTAPPTENS